MSRPFVSRTSMSMLSLLALAACVPLPAPQATPQAGRLAGTYALGEADIHLIGENQDDYAGIRVLTADLDADGIDDVVTAATGFEAQSASTSIGAVYVVSRPQLGDHNLSSNYRTRIVGGTSQGSFGIALAAGDLNGDGFTDLAIGSPGAELDGFDSGAVYVFFGPVPEGDLYASFDADLVIGGSGTFGAEIGTAVAILDDIDGDGIDDLAVGSPGWDGSRGRVGLFRSTDLAAGGTLQMYDAAVELSIGFDGDEFGASLAALDHNGDGLTDLAVGAPGRPSPLSPTPDRGAVHVISGPLLTADRTILSYEGSDGWEMGEAIAAVGDTNGDGFDDLAIGHPGENKGGGVTLLSGPITDPVMWEARIGKLYGVWSDGDVGVGTTVAAAGDVNADGLDDWLVSAHSRVFLVHGGSLSGLHLVHDKAAAVIDSTWPTSSAATPAIAAGDVDGDGAVDVLFGRKSGESKGDVSIFLGTPDQPQQTVADLQWGDVVISELMPNPTDCSDGSGEWIELHNRTSLPVQLDGLELRDASGNDHFLAAHELAPGGYAVVGRGASDWCMAVGPDLGFVGPTLNNSGDVLELVADGIVVDSVDYASALAGVALQRDEEQWCDAIDPLGATELGTPGQANPPCDTGSDVRSIASLVAGELVVTEILANPAAVADRAGEWVEVYNSSDTAIDLAGLQIRDEVGHTGTIEVSLVVEPGGYAVLGTGDGSSWGAAFTPDAYFGSRPALNNSGDLVELTTGAGVVLDTTVRWGSARSGVAWQLSSDALSAGANDQVGSWCDAVDAETGSTDLGTPGAPNGLCD